jgi:hypothetical protein
MNEARHEQSTTAVANREEESKKKQARNRCSICNIRLRSSAVPINEPEGVPEPHHSWILCRDCYQAVIEEVRRSPVRSPLRLRIAVGMVASVRSPDSFSKTAHSIRDDYRKFVIITMVFVSAMLVHLALIVAIAYVAR